MSKNVVVVGAQWGDEGKGKVVDWLTERVDGVVRFNGGHNAGHTRDQRRKNDSASDPVGHHASDLSLLYRQRCRVFSRSLLL